MKISDIMATVISMGLLGWFFITVRGQNKSDKENKEITDLTKQILLNEKKADDKTKEAEDAYKEYMESLKKFDPNFHNHNDDGESH